MIRMFLVKQSVIYVVDAQGHCLIRLVRATGAPYATDVRLPSIYISPFSTFLSFTFFPLLFLHVLSTILLCLQLRQCHCGLLEGSRPRDLPSTKRGLVPCVAPDRRKKTLDEEVPGALPSIAAALEAARAPIRAVGLPVGAGAALAAEVVGATEVQPTVEHQVREVLHAAQK